METVDQDILLDLELQLVHANTGKRLANYLIDLVAFYGLFFIIVVVYFIASPEARQRATDSSGDEFLLRLFTFLMYGLFMGLVEGIFKGRSLGKLVTGTKVVNEDGTDISFSTALARGFSRLVPFEPFSAFGTPWHDKWNRTYVIDVRQSGLQ